MALAIGAYAVTPAGQMSSGNIALRTVAAVALLGVGTIVAIRSTMRADLPGLRALEALTAVISLMVVVFAYVHLVSSEADPSAFSEPLDHTAALYFSVTLSTTIGFGDIAPTSNAARIVVMVQMVANVIVLGVVARVLVGAARRRSDR